MTGRPSVVLVAALGSDLCIGRGGELPFRLPGDLRRFRALTLGRPVVMGRRTWDSLPRRPLPGRPNLVVSRSMPGTEGATVARSLEEALDAAAATGAAETMVIGGGEIYALALPLADRLELTHVGAPVPGGDAFFPEFRDGPWTRVRQEAADEGGLPVTYATWVRRASLPTGTPA